MGGPHTAVSTHFAKSRRASLVVPRNSLVLRQILTCFPALQAIKATILHKPDFMLSEA